MRSNQDNRTIKSFGEEWKRFNQDKLGKEESEKIFNKYFSIFPWESLHRDAVGFDMGCGTGRWAKLVAKRVKHLNCIDPSAALEVAKQNLSEFNNVTYLNEASHSISLDADSQDFGYSLGVLHHIPDTEQALKDCVHLLKKGSPMLVYLYYALDNRSILFKGIWIISNIMRSLISRLPNKIKLIVTDILALIIYLPLAKFCYLLSFLKINVSKIPLSFYKDCSFYTMRTDSRDRFGTPLERRFTKQEIMVMMNNAGLENLKFREQEPYWCCVGIKK